MILFSLHGVGMQLEGHCMGYMGIEWRFIWHTGSHTGSIEYTLQVLEFKILCQFVHLNLGTTPNC